MSSNNMHQINSKNRKLELSLCNEVPASSEIGSCLGSSLAQAFFDYSHIDAKKLMGFNGSAGAAIKDRSNNDNAISKPKDNQIIKATIHQNILAIGEELLVKFQEEIEENLRDYVESQFQEKFHIWQAKQRREIELIGEKLHSKYENYIQTVKQDWEKEVEAEWANIHAQCCKNVQKSVVQERLDVTHEMMKKMRKEIRYIVETLYAEFAESGRAQRENMIADFNEIVRKDHVKLNKGMDVFKDIRSKDMDIQKHELEMQSTVDLIYVLCMERFRNRSEKHAIHAHFEVSGRKYINVFPIFTEFIVIRDDALLPEQKEIRTMQVLIKRLNEIMYIMREEIINSHLKRKSLEEHIRDITKEFQKFINFALCAVPGQAEFLLPPESLSLINSFNEEEKDNASSDN